MRKDIQLYWNTFIKKVLKVTVQKCSWETAWWNEGPMTLIFQRWFGLGSVGYFFFEKHIPTILALNSKWTINQTLQNKNQQMYAIFKSWSLYSMRTLVCMLFFSHTPRSLTMFARKKWMGLEDGLLSFRGQRHIFMGFCCLILANLEIYLQICVEYVHIVILHNVFWYEDIAV